MKYLTKKRLFFAGATLFVLLVLGLVYGRNLPVHFQSPALSGTVVDTATGKPLAGVTVQVRWSAMRSTANMHEPEAMDINLAMVVTDTNGVFNVPAWGPVTVSGGWFYFLTDPEATFSKGGKDLGQVYNKNHAGFEEVTPWPLETVTYEKPSWNGQTIPR